VAIDKPLSLRRQRGSTSLRRSRREDQSILQAEVFVDTGVFHLDEPYSYLIETRMQSDIEIGTVVWVHFNNHRVLGVVKDIRAKTSSGLKYIDSIASIHRLDEKLLQLLERLKDRYVASRFDLLRFMLPPITKAQVAKPAIKSASFLTHVENRNPQRLFLQCEIGQDPLDAVLKLITKTGQIRRLVVVPTLRHLRYLIERLREYEIAGVVELGSHLKPNQRRNAYASLSDTNTRIVIATRGGIFAPLTNLEEIIVVEEFSPHHFEAKAPYWNTRDVALLRAEIEKASIVFVGNSCSLELMRLIESGWIKSKSFQALRLRSKRIKVSSAPSALHSIVREGLKIGSVLISVVDKRFSNLFSCERCRTIARCECGGRVVIQSRSAFGCSICDKTTNVWNCSECGANTVRPIRIGAERIHEDIGKSFPGIPILLNTSEKALENVPPKGAIFVSTFGVEPRIQGGYGAIALLGGEDLVNRPFIRSEEETLNRWFSILANLHNDGFIYLSLPSEHRISQAIIRQNPMQFLRGESHERESLQLPPHRRLVTIEGDVLSIPSLRRRIDDQFRGKLISHISNNGKTLTIRVDHSFASDLLTSLRALQKLRSLQKKNLLSIHVDPYSV
jgi:primosomal protein N' (replication factor Y) (superfamily II helicase)